MLIILDFLINNARMAKCGLFKSELQDAYIYIYIKGNLQDILCKYDVSSSKATQRISNWIAVVAIVSIERIASMRSLAPFLM